MKFVSYGTLVHNMHIKPTQKINIKWMTADCLLSFKYINIFLLHVSLMFSIKKWVRKFKRIKSHITAISVMVGSGLESSNSSLSKVFELKFYFKWYELRSIFICIIYFHKNFCLLSILRFNISRICFTLHRSVVEYFEYTIYCLSNYYEIPRSVSSVHNKLYYNLLNIFNVCQNSLKRR